MFHAQDLQVAKGRASEAAAKLEQYRVQNRELQKQCQDLQGEKEALKAMVWDYVVVSWDVNDL